MVKCLPHEHKELSLDPQDPRKKPHSVLGERRQWDPWKTIPPLTGGPAGLCRATVFPMGFANVIKDNRRIQGTMRGQNRLLCSKMLSAPGQKPIPHTQIQGDSSCS